MTEDFTPAYLKLEPSELPARAQRLREMLSPCQLCPRVCGVNRTGGEKGECGGGERALVSSHNLHFGEEPPLVGHGGSGTIFLAGCSLHCLFCQNYPISQFRHGEEVSAHRLAEMMLWLQERGAENINFVTPTHFSAQILEALALAARKGLRLPLVWNTGGYERIEVLELLDGIVDLYLPDCKYADSELAVALSEAPEYARINQAAIREMWQQVGMLRMQNGIAQRGLLVRHLVLPGQLANTHGVLEFLAGISGDIAVSVMSQYFPAHRAHEHPTLSRLLTREEWLQVQQWVEELRMREGYVQPTS